MQRTAKHIAVRTNENFHVGNSTAGASSSSGRNASNDLRSVSLTSSTDVLLMSLLGLKVPFGLASSGTWRDTLFSSFDGFLLGLRVLFGLVSSAPSETVTLRSFEGLPSLLLRVVLLGVGSSGIRRVPFSSSSFVRSLLYLKQLLRLGFVSSIENCMFE